MEKKLRERMRVCGRAGRYAVNAHAERITQKSIVPSTENAQGKAIEIKKTIIEQKSKIANEFVKIVHRVELIHSRSERNNKNNKFRDRILQVFI